MCNFAFSNVKFQPPLGSVVLHCIQCFLQLLLVLASPPSLVHLGVVWKLFLKISFTDRTINNRDLEPCLEAGKRKFVLLGWQTVNGNRRLLHQQTCPFMLIARRIASVSHWGLLLFLSLLDSTNFFNTVSLIFF